MIGVSGARSVRSALGAACLVAALFSALVGVPQAFAVTGDHLAPDGRYSASARCNEGYDVTVDFDVQDGTVANVKYSPASAAGNEPYYGVAIGEIEVEGIAASPNAASGVDVVSGATHTCDAIKQAIRSAIAGADPGIQVTAGTPVCDKESGRYALSFDAVCTNAAASEAAGSGTELRIVVGSRFDVSAAKVEARAVSLAGDGAEAIDLAVEQRDAHTVAVTGFDYAQHALGSADARKVVVALEQVEPLYAASDQSGVSLYGIETGLYGPKVPASRMAGPAAGPKVSIPGYVALPRGGSHAYTGQTVSGVAYDAARCAAPTGTSQAIEVGTYFAGVSLRPGMCYRWADNTWTARFVEWSIVDGAAGDAGDGGQSDGKEPGTAEDGKGQEGGAASGEAATDAGGKGVDSSASGDKPQTGDLTVKPKVSKGSLVKVSGQTYKVTKVATAKKAGAVTLAKAKNAKTATVPASVKLADGRKYSVTALAARAFSGTKAVKAVVKTKALSKAKSVKKCFAGSKVRTVQVKVGAAKANKQYVKKYKKLFTRANTATKAKKLEVRR